MYVCVCAYTYVCMYVCMYVCTYVRTYVRMITMILEIILKILQITDTVYLMCMYVYKCTPHAHTLWTGNYVRMYTAVTLQDIVTYVYINYIY